jgi:integrase
VIASVADTRVQRQVAPGIVERHQSGCAYARGRRRCVCRPVYRAQVRITIRGVTTTATRTLATLEEATAWRLRAREEARRSGSVSPAPEPVPSPAFGAAAREFLHRAAGGRALTRARKPYSRATLVSYESVLRLHVLPHVDERRRAPFGELPADVVDGRSLQAMVNAVTAGASPALARVADAAASAVLRDLYERGLLEVIPPRPVLPPPPRPRGERLTLAQTDALLAAAAGDDAATGRSLMAPLIALLINGGLRISEALSLTWGPGGVDLEEAPPRLTIGRAAAKTDAGARTIGLDAATASALRRHRESTGDPPDGSVVFTDTQGTRLTRDGLVRSSLRRVAKAAGVPAGFHLLRHTHGSLLADAGQGGHEIAARLGHRDAGFTARTYVHADRNRLADAPAALDALRERERLRALRLPEAGDPRTGRRAG